MKLTTPVENHSTIPCHAMPYQLSFSQIPLSLSALSLSLSPLLLSAFPLSLPPSLPLSLPLSLSLSPSLPPSLSLSLPLSPSFSPSSFSYFSCCSSSSFSSSSCWSVSALSFSVEGTRDTTTTQPLHKWLLGSWLWFEVFDVKQFTAGRGWSVGV